ncbi:YqhA family protein [Nitrincola iocasae]|uniref:YqhA family protein n=1 Tax=Nitrincola iocasae TaxID=2614693 RepID=A0A5J6LBM0_9GAMM|nr:YqhA family protein [Nitrincola iocasae]QEW05965.1 YqhA family protein [Nitrincola iocasae]
MEKLLNKSRFLVLVIVLVCALSSILLYITSIHVIYSIVMEWIVKIPSSADNGKRLAVNLLKVLDTLLIAVTFQIMALGLYRLFISTTASIGSGLFTALKINDFHDLKVTMIQVSMVILVILFLEQAVEIGGTLETLYFGLAIALVIFSSVFAVKSMLESKHPGDK